jgi:hypothetical protein
MPAPALLAAPANAAPAPLAPPSAPSPTSAASDACAGPTDCATCTAKPGCRFCTASPRACFSIAATQAGACGGLSLGLPSSCGSDPVVAARVQAREIEAQRQAALDTARGMTPASTIDARLERFTSIEVPVPANTCHALVWTLAPDAKPGDVSISLDFVTAHTSQGGLTGFSLDTRVGTAGAICSSAAGKERFRLVDRWSRGPVAAGGTGALSFVLSTRPRTAADPDVSAITAMPSPGGGSVGVDCQDCTFPCESSKRACESDCFRSGLSSFERSICDRTCEQMLRGCLRGCPGCN